MTNPVRLFGSDSCTKGTVQVLRSGFWGAVCTTSSGARSNLEVADVVCRGLGITSRSPAATYTYAGSPSSTSSGPPAWVASYSCTGRESSLLGCALEYTNATTATCPGSCQLEVDCDPAGDCNWVVLASQD